MIKNRRRGFSNVAKPVSANFIKPGQRRDFDLEKLLFISKHVSIKRKYHIEDTTFFIKERSWLAALAARKLRTAQVALVFGNTIHLHNCTADRFLNNKPWLRHELVHIRQYRRYGLVRFIVLYLFESMKHGYHNNKFEAEAREAEV